MTGRPAAVESAFVLVGFTLAACATTPSTEGASGASDPSARSTVTASKWPTISPESSQQPEEGKARVAPDLRLLADRFVAYATGESAVFPHWESVSMAIGGQPVKSVDEIGAALSNRDLWKMCPADWDGYAAASCPVDLLGPIQDTVANGASLVYAPEYSEVTCAPLRTGPLPEGRLVVVRPTKDHRDCASDFALALVADEQGRLRGVDLTLSAP